MPRQMFKRAAVLVLIGLLVVIVGAALSSGALSRDDMWANIARGVAGAGSVVLLAWIVLATTDIRPPPGLGRPRPLSPTKGEIALAYYNVARIYDIYTLKLFVNMMVDRPHYLERIHETVSLDDEAPQLRVSTRQVFRIREPELPTQQDKTASRPESNEAGVEGTVSVGPSSVMLLPLVLLEKGTLLDEFGVVDSEGKDLPTLSYNQTRGLIAYVIHAIVDILPVSSDNTELDDTKIKVVSNLVNAICSPRPMKKKSPVESARTTLLLDSIDDLPIREDLKRRVRNFCETLVDHYIIVAEVPVPVGSHVSVSYRQAISVESSALSLANRLRSRVGLRYSTFDIPLNIFSLDVEAYHMEMDAGPMQYVFDHHLERMNSKRLVTQNDLCQGDSKPYVRLHHNSAGPAMHLYIRRQLDPASESPSSSGLGDARVTERLKSVVEFREIPPGALGASTMVALMTAIIVVFFAATQIGKHASGGHAPIIVGSDIPVLVIALPGFASLILGSWLDLSHLRRASLTTYLSLAVSIALSLGSALYYLLDANETLPGRLSLHITGGVVVRTDIGWLVLSAAAVTCCLFLIRDVVSGSRYYFNQVKDHIR